MAVGGPAAFGAAVVYKAGQDRETCEAIQRVQQETPPLFPGYRPQAIDCTPSFLESAVAIEPAILALLVLGALYLLFEHFKQKPA